MTLEHPDLRPRALWFNTLTRVVCEVLWLTYSVGGETVRYGFGLPTFTRPLDEFLAEFLPLPPNAWRAPGEVFPEPEEVEPEEEEKSAPQKPPDLPTYTEQRYRFAKARVLKKAQELEAEANNPNNVRRREAALVLLSDETARALADALARQGDGATAIFSYAGHEQELALTALMALGYTFKINYVDKTIEINP